MSEKLKRPSHHDGYEIEEFSDLKQRIMPEVEQARGNPDRPSENPVLLRGDDPGSNVPGQRVFASEDELKKEEPLLKKHGKVFLTIAVLAGGAVVAIIGHKIHQSRSQKAQQEAES